MHHSTLSVKSSGFSKLLEPRITSVEIFSFDRTIQGFNKVSQDFQKTSFAPF